MADAYYNEIDPYAAQWLRNLIDNNLIAKGDVDERSIRDVAPDDLLGYTQCHFFAGVGVWSHALRLAGWPDDRPVWTGSCPCQPFSAAGQRGGVDDARHLWPDFFRLIGERRPPVVFGEQVASKDGLGWLDLVHADMEGAGYAFGAVDLCAAGFGAPHIRQRLWFVGERLADAVRGGHGEHQRDGGTVGGPASNREGEKSQLGWAAQEAGYRSENGGLGDTRLHGHIADEIRRTVSASDGWGERGVQADPRQPGPVNGVWADADWLYCRDGKWRAVEPGTFPLAHGAPARVGRLRAYGNAIVPQVAAEVIGAFLDARP